MEFLMSENFSRSNADRVSQWFIFLTLIASYLFFFPRWADPNQNSRMDMITAIVEEGTIHIDTYVSNTVDYAKIGDHYYSDKAPGAAFLGLPFYAGLRYFLSLPFINDTVRYLSNNAAFTATLNPTGTGINDLKIRFALGQALVSFIVSALPTAVLGVLIFRFLSQFTIALLPRIFIVFIYGLISPAFPYANAFYGHQLSAALLFAAFYLIFSSKHDLTRWKLLLAGFLMGYSVVTEYPSILIVAILCVYTIYYLNKAKMILRMGWLFLSSSVLALGLFAYNTIVFGGPLVIGYDYSTLWENQHHTGFMSLTMPHLSAVWGITFSPFRGLFFYSPILLLSIIGLYYWWRSKKFLPELLVVFCSFVSIFLFNSASIMWWGGFSVGPRYLLPALPFIAIPAIFTIMSWKNIPWAKIIYVVLTLWSLTATWGLTIAGQSYPSDTISNPLLDYAWPNWLAGNIARNLGTILKLKGVWSLAPLLIILLCLAALWIYSVRHKHNPNILSDEAYSFTPKY
jgi:hypothetical protein